HCAGRQEWNECEALYLCKGCAGWPGGAEAGAGAGGIGGEGGKDGQGGGTEKGGEEGKPPGTGPGGEGGRARAPAAEGRERSGGGRGRAAGGKAGLPPLGRKRQDRPVSAAAVVAEVVAGGDPDALAARGGVVPGARADVQVELARPRGPAGVAVVDEEG